MSEQPSRSEIDAIVNRWDFLADVLLKLRYDVFPGRWRVDLIVEFGHTHLLDKPRALSRRVKDGIGTNPYFWLALRRGHHSDIRDLIFAGCADEIAALYRRQTGLARWEKVGRIIAEDFKKPPGNLRLWIFNLVKRNRDRVRRISSLISNGQVDKVHHSERRKLDERKARPSLDLGRRLFDEFKALQASEHRTISQHDRLDWIRDRISNHALAVATWEGLSGKQKLEFERAQEMDRISAGPSF